MNLFLTNLYRGLWRHSSFILGIGQLKAHGYLHYVISFRRYFESLQPGQHAHMHRWKVVIAHSTDKFLGVWLLKSVHQVLLREEAANDAFHIYTRNGQQGSAATKSAPTLTPWFFYREIWFVQYLSRHGFHIKYCKYVRIITLSYTSQIFDSNESNQKSITSGPGFFVLSCVVFAAVPLPLCLQSALSFYLSSLIGWTLAS